VDEERLIAAAQRGNLDAFNELVLAYQSRVYNLAYRIMGDPAAAADATQEAFISAHNGLPRFRGGSFRSWLLRIVSNACYDELRRRKRHPTSSIHDLGDVDEEANLALVSPGEGPHAQTERYELADLIQTGITTLPPHQRVTLVLADVQGMSYQEVADATDVALGTVKSRLARARARLRDYLREHGELLPHKYRLEGDEG
jgi:RNA polymerase sigma-70 factor (ECF subfamily)